jgi:TPR repeat protein
MRQLTRASNRLSAFAAALLFAMTAVTAAVAEDFDDGLSAFFDGDYRRARAIWLSLAESGDAQSQFGLGMMHERGRGVPPDPEKAFEWYSRAAEQEMAEAQLSLGALYQHGRGVLRDPARAAELYLGAAEQGVAQAQYNLAALYLGGDGVPYDRELGIAWLRRAAAQRYDPAVRRLDMMGLDLEGPEPVMPVAVQPIKTKANERLQILVEGNQFEVPEDALEADSADD